MKKTEEMKQKNVKVSLWTTNVEEMKEKGIDIVNIPVVSEFANLALSRYLENDYDIEDRDKLDWIWVMHEEELTGNDDVGDFKKVDLLWSLHEEELIDRMSAEQDTQDTEKLQLLWFIHRKEINKQIERDLAELKRTEVGFDY